MKTIRRNSPLLKVIFSEQNTCQVFSLNNGYSGKICETACAKRDFEELRFATITYDKDNNRYSVDIHSRLFYHITVVN